MSRHRFVRNINVHEELEEDVLSDGGDDELSPEEHEHMMNCLEQIRATIGTAEQSGISDTEIQDTLYYYQYNVERSINWLYEEQGRKNVAKERKVEKPLPPPPLDEEDPGIGYQANQEYFEPPSSGSGRSNIPLIRLAQPQPDEVYEYSEYAPTPSLRTLSTISEKTEQTDDVGTVTPRTQQQELSSLSRTASFASATTDYGREVIARQEADPNDVVPSPSSSALQRLSYHEPAPSLTPSASRTPSSQPSLRSTTAPVPHIESIPDIPSLRTKKSTVQPASEKRSKLSTLASSRSSTRSSLSTRSDASAADTVSDATVYTYPFLRPTSASIMSFDRDSTTSASSMSSHVRRAIQTALELEAVDRAESVEQSRGRLSPPMAFPKKTSSVESPQPLGAVTSPPPPRLADLSQQPGPTSLSQVTKSTTTQSEKFPTSPELPRSTPQLLSPTNPLQSLAPSVPRLPSASPPRSVASPHVSAPELPTIPNVMRMPTSPPSQGRQPTKLAMLAQAKAQQGRWIPKPKKTVDSASEPALILHKSHTQYFDPIANGPTATTAITTSYQSLSSLLTPAQSALPPSIVPPVRNTTEQSIKPTRTGNESKQSKLAMKSKTALKKPELDTSANEAQPVVQHPMFVPQGSRTRASPSAFASLLTDDAPLITLEEKGHSSKGKGVERSGVHVEDLQLATTSEGSKPRRHSHRKRDSVLPSAPELSPTSGFAFDVPSPDDVVFNARRGTSLAPRSLTASSSAPPAKEREKAAKLAQSKQGSPAKAGSSAGKKVAKETPAAPKKAIGASDASQLDLSALNIRPKEEPVQEEPLKAAIALEKVLDEVRTVLQAQEKNEKRALSLVVIGHVDAGKSTLMGRLLYELGRINEKKRLANERGSSKVGKSSFSWAWELDGTAEERERGITMDIALQYLSTPHREITILDAPGHKDFIPNMISGASQADSALLVVDAATGEFEAGFEKGGQTREHLLLVRSLGVSQVVVAVNKLDQVQWEKSRYDEICDTLKPFLLQSGFHSSKTKFVPVGAMAGVNLTARVGTDSEFLNKWYTGPTLVELLDRLDPPSRNISAPLRFPISNVFREAGSGIGVSGRVCGGVAQVGELLRILPGDGTTYIKSISNDDQSLPWVVDGSNVILYLTSVDPVHLSIGSVLCRPSDLISLATVFTARVIIFDIDIPITAGASIELYHYSRDVPASISKLISITDRATGKVIRKSPRVLTKNASAEIQITLRSGSMSGPSAKAYPIPIEPFAMNKDMGRVLIRRGGETIGAGIVLDVLE
ncbi:uncharacterized protein FIBRA_05503 [Fibroporia radiculosa]|uniref:Elongation factor 1 alpha-like protein n=1 Tax=Fibroporia radiculosa TaxID=599839 RepID=J4G9L3_9APHY|nr:uncharacterized protein FIBRA_05503 [Fibroporia radiculosa]CCM03373.1 predicted protein [Fibroporia radiculosa]